MIMGLVQVAGFSLHTTAGTSFHVAALDVSRFPPGERIEFHWQWQESGAWHGRDYQVAAISADET
jgi:hypothetical protein